jgi:hypothetical protein
MQIYYILIVFTITIIPLVKSQSQYSCETNNFFGGGGCGNSCTNYKDCARCGFYERCCARFNASPNAPKGFCACGVNYNIRQSRTCN